MLRLGRILISRPGDEFESRRLTCLTSAYERHVEVSEPRRASAWTVGPRRLYYKHYGDHSRDLGLTFAADHVAAHGVTQAQRMNL